MNNFKARQSENSLRNHFWLLASRGFSRRRPLQENADRETVLWSKTRALRIFHPANIASYPNDKAPRGSYIQISHYFPLITGAPFYTIPFCIKSTLEYPQILGFRVPWSVFC